MDQHKMVVAFAGLDVTEPINIPPRDRNGAST
jgi:hypothetical protein